MYFIKVLNQATGKEETLAGFVSELEAELYWYEVKEKGQENLLPITQDWPMNR